MPQNAIMTDTSRVGAIEQQLMMASDPARKLGLLRRFVAEIHRDDPAYASGLAGEGYLLATVLHDDEAEADILRYRGLCHMALGRYAAAVEDLTDAHGRFTDLEAHADAAVVSLVIGRAKRELGDPEEALVWYDSSLEICTLHDFLKERADVLEAMGDLRTSLGDYPKALEHYLHALSLRESLSDVHGAGIALSSIGVVHGLLKDYDAAFEYFTKSLAALRESEDRYQEVKVLTNLGSIYYTRGEPERALEHALRASAIYEALGDRQNLGEVMTMVGAIHEGSGDTGAAMGFYMRAYALLDETTDDAPRVAILLNIGRLYVAMRKPEDALFIFDQALRMAESINDLHMQCELHRAVAELHERAGQLGPALDHFKQYAGIRDRLAGEEKQRSIAELQVRFDLEQAEREREIYRLKAQGLEAQMRLKQNELATMALNLLQKKELLDEMKAEIRRMQEKRSGGGAKQVEEFLGQIENVQHSDEDWKRFEQQLDSLHQDFIRTLSAAYPMLTPAELKICSLARIDLVTKEIADILFTSVRTVQVHKYNIRKKLALPSHINLTTFLAGLS
ncbi:MAG: tetratricopeptide repeat protein [Bacteroidetes bacterium]|nr:tetratricopeptide repeat protein [Bacteroidota bacterium]